MGQRKAWTEDDDTILRQMLSEGFAAKEIGAELGRTAGSVDQRKLALKLTRPAGVERRRAGASMRSVMPAEEGEPEPEPAPGAVHELLRAAVYCARVMDAERACKAVGWPGQEATKLPKELAVETRWTPDGWEVELPAAFEGVRAIRVVRR